MISQKERQQLIIAGLAGVIVAGLLASLIFHGVSGKGTNVPVPEMISSDFPAVGGDSHYQKIFNSKALDPTQAVQLGSQNGQPFGQ